MGYITNNAARFNLKVKRANVRLLPWILPESHSYPSCLAQAIYYANRKANPDKYPPFKERNEIGPENWETLWEPMKDRCFDNCGTMGKKGVRCEGQHGHCRGQGSQPRCQSQECGCNGSVSVHPPPPL